MRSSVMVVFRAIVMLAVLLLAALLYNSPEQRHKLLESIVTSRWFWDVTVGETPSKTADHAITDSHSGATALEALEQAPAWRYDSRKDATRPRIGGQYSSTGARRPHVEPRRWSSPAMPMAETAAPAARPAPSAIANTGGSFRFERIGPAGRPAAYSLTDQVEMAVQSAGYEDLPEALSRRRQVGGQQPRFDSSATTVAPAQDESDSVQPSSSGSHVPGPIMFGPDDRPAKVSGVQNLRRDANGPDRFTRIERRLRELGATYYLLESWGTEGNLFRFHCRMAIGGRRQQNRYFEATDEDPLRAMDRVLHEVERWRFGRAL